MTSTLTETFEQASARRLHEAWQRPVHFIVVEGVRTSPTMAAAAPMLNLGAHVDLVYYCADDMTPTQAYAFRAVLDPAKNRGHVRARVQGFGPDAQVTVQTDEGDWSSLTTPCRDCGSMWAIYRQQGYGDSVDCPDCGKHDWHSIGD